MDPTNILVQVQTYNKESLAYLENLNCFIGTLNKKFKALREGKPEGNLGDTLHSIYHHVLLQIKV
jgi:hypothetical protein